MYFLISFLSQTLQIALTDVLFLMGVTPDGIIGHSTGEMGCGYADGGLTRAQTMELAYYRGSTIMEGRLQGGMAAVGLTWFDVLLYLKRSVGSLLKSSSM